MRLKTASCVVAMILTGVRAWAAALPQGYTELEFIRGDGHEYLNTGYTPNSVDFGFSLDCVYCDEVALSGNSILMGSSKRNNGFWGGLTLSGWAGTPGGQLIVCKTTGDMYDPGLVRGERMRIEVKNGHYSNSTGTSFDLDMRTSDQFNGPVYVFAMNRDDKTPAETGMMKGRVYRLRFYKGEEVTHDFIPAKDSSGHVGLYDVVGNLGFRTSATASPFLAPTCTTLVYVKSTGSQYLDTGYTPKDAGFGFWLDFCYENAIDTSGYAQILGSSMRNSGFWGGLIMGGYPSTPGGQFRFCDTAGDVWTDPGIVPGQRLQIGLKDKVLSNSLVPSPSQIQVYTTDYFYGSLWLGKIHTETPADRSMSGRYYGLKLYAGSKLVRNFYPCLDLASGRAGFQELLSDEFYPSESDDDFVAGPDVYALTVRSDPPGRGEVDQGYGAHQVTSGLKIRAGKKWIDPETGLVYACTGWSLLDESGAEIDSKASLVCRFTGAGMGRELVWKWTIYRLPEQGYDLVEYVESDGAQAADLGITPDEKTRVVYDFQYTAVDNTKRTLNGWGSAASQDAYSWGHAEAAKCTCWEYFSSAIGEGWNFASTGVKLDAERHVFDLAPGRQSFDGRVYANAIPVAKPYSEDPTAHQHLYVGAQHPGWLGTVGAAVANTSERIYRCTVYSGETVEADLVPCVRTLDSVAGFYDLKRRSFISSFVANAAFKAGPAAEPQLLPDGIGLFIVVK